MNRIFKHTLFLVCFFSTNFYVLNAQSDNNTDAHEVGITVPEVAILDIEPSGSSFTLQPEKPTEAGMQLDFTNATNKDLWLNYSSIVGSSSNPARSVNVKIDGGAVPDGLLLKVEAGNDVGKGDGIVGVPTGVVTLSENAQNLIDKIGSCYTNSPQENGHNLKYTLELNSAEGSYGKIDFDQTTTLKVIYTITE